MFVRVHNLALVNCRVDCMLETVTNIIMLRGSFKIIVNIYIFGRGGPEYYLEKVHILASYKN